MLQKERNLMTKTFVCIGNSFTAGYPYYFPGIGGDETGSYPYWLKLFLNKHEINARIINKGINGNTTTQMLQRFEHDVISLQPDYVIILGGANDLQQNEDIGTIIDNLRNMVYLAKSNSITPILSTIPPINKRIVSWRQQLQLREKITNLSFQLRAPLVDIFTALKDVDELKEAYKNEDGIHLNKEGYKYLAYLIYKEIMKIFCIPALPMSNFQK